MAASQPREAHFRSLFEAEYDSDHGTITPGFIIFDDTRRTIEFADRPVLTKATHVEPLKCVLDDLEPGE